VLLSSYVLGRAIDAQSIIREELSQSHGGVPPFRSGNCVGASPYEAAYLEYFQENVQRANFVERRLAELRGILIPRTSVNKGKK
jgi:hypothetical protein